MQDHMIQGFYSQQWQTTLPRGKGRYRNKSNQKVIRDHQYEARTWHQRLNFLQWSRGTLQLQLHLGLVLGVSEVETRPLTERRQGLEISEHTCSIFLEPTSLRRCHNDQNTLKFGQKHHFYAKILTRLCQNGPRRHQTLKFWEPRS